MENLPKTKVDNSASKYFNMLNCLERQIMTNLEEAGIETRPAKRNGLWCFTLLPIILLVYSWLDMVSHLYKITAFISMGLYFYCFLFILFLSTSSAVLEEPKYYGGCVTSGLISTLLVYLFLKEGFLFSLSVSLPSVYFFSWLLRTSLTKFQKTFTIGEAMIVSQTITLFTMMSFIKFFFEMQSADEEMEFIYVIVYTILSTVALMVSALSFLWDEQRNLKTLTYIVVSGAIFAILLLHSILGNCTITIFKYVFVERNRAQILVFWLALSSLAVCALLLRTRLAVKATTVTRKTFHVLASLVFLSGILLDVYLMTLAAGVGLGAIVLVEALRKSRIDPISSALQAAFLVYSDEKDSGSFAMTPLYLYAGLACPLLLAPARAPPLELLSGVLAIGVGDTAASWFGSRFGFNKWSDTNRTMEGTVFNILSQVLTVYGLQLFDLLNSNNALLRTAFAAMVSGLVEAKTNQVDNLVLPLITLMAFQATWVLR